MDPARRRPRMREGAVLTGRMARAVVHTHPVCGSNPVDLRTGCWAAHIYMHWGPPPSNTDAHAAGAGRERRLAA